jgi:ribosomal protein S25
MASQFESLWQPFVILFTIPLSIIGVIAILLFTNTPLSIMVILGVIVLGGIVVNNGIVLIDYANILRKKGMSAYDAVITASRRRLRPIIMTVLTTILGLVPLALALNDGAQLQQPMAIAVIGGLAVSTFLSLVVIPTIYLGLDEIISSITNKNKQQPIDEQDNGPGTKPPEKQPEPTPAPQAGLEKESEHTKSEGLDKAEGPMPDKQEVAAQGQSPAAGFREKQPLIEYEDDMVRDKTPQRIEIKEDEITPPIILPYKTEGADTVFGKTPGDSDSASKDYSNTGTVYDKDTSRFESDKGKSKKIREKTFDTKAGQSADISERHKELIDYLKEHKRITRKGYADKFNISIPTAARDLRQLVKSGIITAKGPAAVGRYYVLKDSV